MAQTPIKALVISISDTRHKDDDVSGVTLIGLLLGIKAEVHEKIIVSDDLVEIKDALMTNSARDDVNLILAARQHARSHAGRYRTRGAGTGRGNEA